jgi:ketosteroid isomerase-like protein
MRSILERLNDAQNAHDAHRMASYFAEDYLSAQPVHPSRAFSGRAQVLANWTSVFEGVPNFSSELLASSVEGETEWAEVDWQGQHTDGSPSRCAG